MKCPVCGKKLAGIPPCSKEEWACLNDDCPSNKNHGAAHSEFYGLTQAEVNASNIHPTNVKEPINEGKTEC